MKSRVLVTGAAGFIGKCLAKVLIERGSSVRRCGRNTGLNIDIAVGDIGEDTDWSRALSGVDKVVHLMALAHVGNAADKGLIDEYRRVNVGACVNLARQAAEAGVNRFVFLSSIGVNGERNDIPFTEQVSPVPVRPYAVSKLEAEQALRELAIETGIEVVIIRPPLVYGPDAPGNFARLVKLAGLGLPLPLGAVRNRRSFIALDNLVDFIAVCLDEDAAANETFVVADGEDISTSELLRRMGRLLDRPVILIPVPLRILLALAAFFGRTSEVEQLCSSLTVDISKARQVLGWHPPISLAEGLHRALKNPA